VAAMSVALLIGLSRLYLGVHFVHDVLVGWLLGGLILWLFVKYWEPTAAHLKKMTLTNQILTVFAVSIGVILIGWVVILLSRGFVLPQEWIVNAMRDGNAEPDPLNIKSLVTSMATLFGMGAGVAWTESRGGFSAQGPVTKRVLRYIVGLVGVAVFYVGLDMIFPDGTSLLPLILRYIRYALVGAWISAGAPWIFAKLKLTGQAS
jgi:hypothetical protein